MAIRYCPELVSRTMEENPNLASRIAPVEIFWEPTSSIVEFYNINTSKSQRFKLKDEQNNEDSLVSMLAILSSTEKI